MYVCMLNILLSIVSWLVSGFFTNAFMRDRVFHPCKTHWLKIFAFRLLGRCLSRKMYLYFAKTLHPAFILNEASLFVLFSIAIVCARSLYFSHLLYFCPVCLYVVCCVNIRHKLSYAFTHPTANLEAFFIHSV